MGNSIELKNQIENAIKHTELDYAEALEAVERLKNKMNKLEQDISKKGQTAATMDSNFLDFTIKSLNELTDSQILRSKKAWEEYRKLEADCKQDSLQPIELDNLKILCKKMEELAADLLCYSLGRFKPTER